VSAEKYCHAFSRPLAEMDALARKVSAIHGIDIKGTLTLMFLTEYRKSLDDFLLEKLNDLLQSETTFYRAPGRQQPEDSTAILDRFFSVHVSEDNLASPT
jgi:hypothetical protein